MKNGDSNKSEKNNDLVDSSKNDENEMNKEEIKGKCFNILIFIL